MANIKDELPKLMGMKPQDGRVNIRVDDEMLVCTTTPDDAMKVHDTLDNLIREVDLMGTKAGSVRVLHAYQGSTPNKELSYAVKLVDLHKCYQEMCGVQLNGRAHH